MYTPKHLFFITCLKNLLIGYREKNQSAMKGVVESNEREGTMSHEKASIELLGARHEEQQWKLDQAMNSKKESIRAKQRQGKPIPL